MSKNIIYWMEYASFLKLAEKALSMGMRILKKQEGKIQESDNISIVTEDCRDYYFYLPELGKYTIDDYGSYQTIDATGISGNVIIGSGFSRIDNNARHIIQHRMYVQSGFYDNSGNWVELPKKLSDAYDTLEAFVKELAPYTEITDTYISRREENYNQRVEYKRNDYISPYCLDLKNNRHYSIR